MSETTLDLYTALVDAGIEKKKAEAVARSVISREEARTLATKSDIGEIKGEINELKTEILKMMVVQSLAIITLTVALIELLS